MESRHRVLRSTIQRVNLCSDPGSKLTSIELNQSFTLKSRCSTWAATSNNCGCANQAVPVAVSVIAANLARLLKLRRGVQAVCLQRG